MASLRIYICYMDLLTSLRKATALDRLADLEVQDAVLFADRARALVDVEDVCAAQPDSEQAMSFIALDIATACDIAQSTATMRLGRAKHLVHDLPQTLEQLRVGQLRVGQALVLMEETKDLPRATCHAIETKALPKLAGLTSGDTRRVVKRIVVQVDAEASEARRQAKIRERRIWNSPRPDGRAVIGAELSAEDAGSFERALKALAKNLYGPHQPAPDGSVDQRTLDQQCADLFASLPHFTISHLSEDGPSLREFLGTGTSAGPGSGLSRRIAKRVQAIVLVPVETGLNLANNAADLIDYGPITSYHARDLLAAAELRKACTDLTTGRMLALHDTLSHAAGPSWRASELEAELLTMVLDTTPVEARLEGRHDPSPALSDFIRYRDTRCVGPGCSAPAHTCDLEHLDAYPNGQTTADNLGPASRRCHNAKTHGGWTLAPHPDGSITWTSPLGRSFTRPSRTQPPDLTNLRPPRRDRPAQPRQDKGSTAHEDPESAPDTNAA